MTERLVTVFGGTGFLGRNVVRQLAEKGYRVRVAVRDPEVGQFLKLLGDVGQVALVQANIRDDASVERAVAGAEAVFNLVGILYETGRQRFDAVHVAAADRVARAAKAAGAKRLVHVSAIGADIASESAYARSKAEGEAVVREAFPEATIVRPSLLFGPEDEFFNRFASLSRFLWVLPLIGGGRTRFQPVYVGDVARAMVAALERADAAGKTFEFGGPRVYSFRELMELVLRETGRKCLLVPVPVWAAMIEAAFLELLPKPLLTRDQVRMLQVDNVVAPGAPGLADLGIAPAPVEVVVPSYLARYRRAGGTGDTVSA